MCYAAIIVVVKIGAHVETDKEALVLSSRGTSGDYPRQPPTEFDLPQPEPPESTITNSRPSNPITTQPTPSDGTWSGDETTLTEAPPPVYDLQDDYIYHI